MLSPRLLLVLFLALILSPAIAQAPAEEVEEIDIEALKARQLEAIDAYAKGMEELAAWADKNDIFASRNRVYEDLILRRAVLLEMDVGD